MDISNLEKWHFEKTEKAANYLLKLVLEGKKRATSSSLWAYEIEGEEVPKVGDRSIITYWDGIPSCVIETTNVSIIPYSDMTYDIAALEGEDETLESWQKTHRQFFSEEGKELGYTFSENMPVVFEEFEVIEVLRSMNIIVRLEEERDYRRVEEMTRCAFGYQERIERGQIGCPYEHWMVHELRKRDGIPALSLVAEVEGHIVGHIICSKAEVRTERLIAPVLNMGPISVLPQYQRKGIGKALITGMLDRAKQLGYGAILFFGRPEYYPQFGFREASVFGITDSEGYNYPSFMGMELVPDYLAPAYGGKYYESDIYNDELNREAVKEFDKEFLGIPEEAW